MKKVTSDRENLERKGSAETDLQLNIRGICEVYLHDDNGVNKLVHVRGNGKYDAAASGV